ncbi:MAG: rane protein involved in the export of O-antigen and teichoic acid [Frankiales bacterium]|nr:rane protein involved in the export of O-antigen and teichoic acid [Frankiales bacterium]
MNRTALFARNEVTLTSSSADSLRGPIALESELADAARPRVPSLRKNIAWSVAGYAVYAASQWAMLVILAKMTSTQAVGQFALGLALTAPFVQISNLQLRAALVTDAGGTHKFDEYLSLRLACVALTLIGAGATAWLAGYSQQTLLVIFGITVAKAAESIIDIFHALLQRHQRMELIARSALAKSVLSLTLFTAALAITRDVVWGVVMLATAWSLVLVGYDIPLARRLARRLEPRVCLRPRWRWRSLLALVKLTLPLGLAAMLVALNSNVPRYFIEVELGEQSLGIFAALAYFVIAGLTAVIAVGESVTPRLADHHASGHTDAYLRLLGKLLGLAALVGVAGVLATVIFGRLALELLYGAEYAAESRAFLWIMVAGMLTYMATILNLGLLAARRFKVQLALLAGVTLVLCGGCAYFVPRWGLTGAALALCCASGVHVLVAGSLIFVGVRKPPTSRDYNP